MTLKYERSCEGRRGGTKMPAFGGTAGGEDCGDGASCDVDVINIFAGPIILGQELRR